MEWTFDVDKVFTITRGEALPLGSSITKNGTNFSVFSRHATDVWLALFVSGESQPITEIKLDPLINRTGDIWHVCIKGLDSKIRYGYRMDRQPNTCPDIYRFNPKQILVDPFAKALSGGSCWGEQYISEDNEGRDLRIRKRRSLIIEDDFDWEGDRQLNTPLEDTIIYELHVRGYTIHPNAKSKHPGTFLGLTEKIPYLKDLGVTAIELLPIYEFEETDTDRINPKTKQPLLNYWGYHPINFFAPKAAYASNGLFGMQVREFKEMVKIFHQNGIEVILDVVFNHTAEGNEKGNTFSFRGIDNPVYYIVGAQNGDYYNYSGCGNTLNCNHPVVRNMIIDSLRYWVTEMHVDGFRFDLASILGRGRDGSVLSNPPLLEQIAGDPILADTKLIAEAWDAAGLYQVGNFPHWGRWAEWNGQFRDDVRQFVKGELGLTGRIANRLLGSPELYGPSGRTPYHSINFVTSHDGFTLHDLVAYNEKHNEENGEDNRDGDNHNSSWNCGVEGATSNPEILRLREQQAKNMATLLLLSDGVPMIVAGDEFSRTQGGNNNAYCQDNPISWVDWSLLEKNHSLHRFFKELITFRKLHPLIRHKEYISKNHAEISIDFHGLQLSKPDFSYTSRTIAMHIHCKNREKSQERKFSGIYLMLNAHWENHNFSLPALSTPGCQWHLKIDTSKRSPKDILSRPSLLPNQKNYPVAARSVVVLISKQ